MELLMPNHIKCWAEWFGLIDISWLDWAYKSSTCDVMYRRQRRHLYIMVVKFGNTIVGPSTATLPS
jgi:hypothetical protein